MNALAQSYKDENSKFELDRKANVSQEKQSLPTNILKEEKVLTKVFPVSNLDGVRKTTYPDSCDEDEQVPLKRLKGFVDESENEKNPA